MGDGIDYAPTFINFGPNYTGARDGFVYVISHDTNSAYETADAYVLARAPRGRLDQRAAWEYFAGTNGEEPVWTRDVKRRTSILQTPRKCYRVGVSYDAPLDRFILVHPVVAIQATVSRTIDRRRISMQIRQLDQRSHEIRTVPRVKERSVHMAVLRHQLDVRLLPPSFCLLDG